MYHPSLEKGADIKRGGLEGGLTEKKGADIKLGGLVGGLTGKKGILPIILNNAPFPRAF